MFYDRDEAAVKLAGAVALERPKDPVVLALPRGGVPLGAVVAEKLSAPLDLVLVRKIGMPGHRELAAGAIVDGDPPVILWNEGVTALSGLSEADFADEIARLKSEIETRRGLYLAGRAPVPVAGRTAIVVDDGVATGATVRVAIQALRQRNPAEIWVAVPVAPPDTASTLEAESDRLICLERPDPFWAVGAHYKDFRQVTDDEVVRLMARAGAQGGD